MDFRANIPLQTPGLISPELAKTYRSIVSELSRGAEPPSRELGLTPGEGAATGAARLLKLYALDYPMEFLRLGAKGIEDPSRLSSSELLELAGGAISGGLPGGGLGPASMAGRVPLKGFYSPLQKGIRELVKEGTAKTKPGKALQTELRRPKLVEDLGELEQFYKKQPMARKLNILATGEFKPLDTLNNAIIVDSLKDIRSLYKKDPRKLAKSTELYSKLKKETITDKELDTWLALEPEQRIQAGKLHDYAEDPEGLFALTSTGAIISPKQTLKPKLTSLGPVTKPGQALLNLLKKKGVSKEELEYTGVEAMLQGGQKPIPLKDVMRQAVREEIKVEPRVLRPRSLEALELSARESKLTNLGRPITETEHKELIGVRKQMQQIKQSFSQYAEPAYRKPFQPSSDIPYEETLLTLKGRGEKFKDPAHYQDVEDLVAWSRSEVRSGESGEKVRLIQEVQESEWGIKGRKEGFGKPTGILPEERAKLLSYGERSSKGETFTVAEEAEWLELAGKATEEIIPIPQTPFKKDALKLMLKKELFEAASDPTVTHLGWTPGSMQAFERWPAPEAEKKLLQLYDELIPGFLKKQTRRLGKGKEVKLEEIPLVSGKDRSERLRQYEQGFLTGEEYKKLKTLPERVPTYKKVPAIKMEDWLREAILKGQRVAKVDQTPFEEFLYG